MNYENYTTDDFLMDDLFLGYCQGSDPAAVRFWETWQLKKPANLAAFQEAERLYKVLSGNKPRLDESLRELEALIHAQQPPPKVVPLPVQKTPGSARWWLVAASVLLTVALSWAGYQFWQHQYITYETGYNQKRMVRLPDGSTVALNSHSLLRYRRNDFSDDRRFVELTGEGFFDVRHLSVHTPFMVGTTGAFDIQVTGTEFSLYNRPALHRVVLNTGRVQVLFHDKRPAVVLKPGQLIELDGRARTTGPRTGQVDQYNAWLRNQLVFDNTSLSEAIHIVEEQFGVSVEVDRVDISRRKVSGILPISSPETVLNALSSLAQLTIRKRDNVFVLSHQ